MEGAFDGHSARVTSSCPLLYIHTSFHLSLLLNTGEHQNSYDFALVCAEYKDDPYIYTFDMLKHIGIRPRQVSAAQILLNVVGTSITHSTSLLHGDGTDVGQRWRVHM